MIKNNLKPRPALLTALLFIIISLTQQSFALQNQTAGLDASFNDHSAIILFIESDTGDILYVNKAAAKFYGYTKDQMTSMHISKICTKEADELSQCIKEAGNAKESLSVCRHKLANDELCWMEIHSSPVEYQGRTALFTIVHDINDSILLKEKREKLIIASAVAAIVLLIAFLLLVLNLRKNTKSLRIAYKDLKGFNTQKEAFMNAYSGFIYLKDKDLKYVFANETMKSHFELTDEKLTGYDDFDIMTSEFAENNTRSDKNALRENRLITDTIPWRNKFLRLTKFPVHMPNGTVGVGSYIRDVTEEHRQKQHRQKMLQHKKLLLDVTTHNFNNTQEQLDYVLHKLLKMSGSQYGYIYFYSEDKKEFVLNSWTQGVMKSCTVKGTPKIYQLEKTGIWGEVVRQRKPIIVNDFEKSNPLKKGYPEGHVELKKFMSIPVIIDDEIVAVVGFGNKPTDYDDADVREMTILMSGVWNAVKRRETEETLAMERNKYYQTLLSIGDGVLVISQNKNIVFLNSVAEKLTGWSMKEALGIPYKEIFAISHEQEGFTINDPVAIAFDTGRIQELGNHAILTSKTGKRYYLEDSAAPIFDENGSMTGVVLVFRDITEKKEQRKKIEYMSFHDSLTGLYNRRFFEEEMSRLDTKRNLPISILIGDVNNLKLTNDIFGHAFGDMVLERVSEIMQHASRADDIIARWGGDEFVILLPKTSQNEAEILASRIKEQISTQQIRAVKCSISMGWDTKTSMDEDIVRTLNNAEIKMYSAKTLGREETQDYELYSIIKTLYESGERENEHAKNVGRICKKIGLALKLSESDMLRLNQVAHLHDIGKIALSTKLLNNYYYLSAVEQKEAALHPVIGYRVLNHFDETVELADAVLAHHENWDGTGYPKGLKSKMIPLFARIISLANTYDRMLNDPKTKSEEEVIKKIKDLSGIKFDPNLVDILVDVLKGPVS